MSKFYYYFLGALILNFFCLQLAFAGWGDSERSDFDKSYKSRPDLIGHYCDDPTNPDPEKIASEVVTVIPHVSGEIAVRKHEIKTFPCMVKNT